MAHLKRLVGLLVLGLMAVALAGGSAGSPPLAGPPLPAKALRDLRLVAAPDGDLLLGVIQDDQEGASWRGSFQGRVVRLYRQHAGAWTPLGGVLNYDQPRPVSNLDLAVDRAGTPVMVWNENYGDNDVIVFRAFQQGAWTDWRTRYLGISSPVAARTRAVTALNGEPVLIHGEYRRTDGVNQTWLTYRAWDEAGKTWSRTPPVNDLRQFSRSPAVALNAQDQPVVAFLQGEVLQTQLLVKRWNGTAWEALGGTLNRGNPSYLTAPRLVLGTQDHPTVAWTEDVAGLDILHAARWDGTRWQPLGGRISRTSASQVALALDGQGRPALAWVEERGDQGQLHLARWDGRAWVQAGPLNLDPGRDARNPAIALSGGNLVLAWREDVNGRYTLQLRELSQQALSR